MILRTNANAVLLNAEQSGITMVFPAPGMVSQMQSNLASTLNIDWLLDVALGVLAESGVNKSRADLLKGMDEMLLAREPAKLLYHPYISRAGERGPFMNTAARAMFNGLDTTADYYDMMRGVFEGLAFASRDCYAVMGPIPKEIRLTGGAMFMNMPGLKIMVPASPTDAKGLLRTAIDMDDPVMSFEACMLWGMKEDVDEGEFRIPFGVARTVREGGDVTIVAISSAVPQAVLAAQKLEAEGVSAEIIDPRTLVPLDSEAIFKSVARTGRLVIADPANKTCGAAAEISALVSETVFDSLKAPILRVTTPDTHIPFSPALEKQLYPTADKIANAVRKVINAKSRGH